MNICYDGGFPESARVLALLGADLILLPTNWPTGAAGTADFVIRSRAMENHVYYAAVNRIGTERGFRFIGKTRVAACDGTLLTTAGDGPEIVFADVDPEQARRKREIKVPGKYELDRIADRRPEMYGELVK
jgi:predicted amidohydrolase